MTTTKTTFTSLKAGCHLRLVVPVVSVVFQKPKADCCANAAACKEVPRLDQPGLKRRPACKAVLSEAVVTRDTVPGLYATGRTVCKTVPCYILSLIRGTAITSRWSVGPFWVHQTVHPNYLYNPCTAYCALLASDNSRVGFTTLLYVTY